MEEARDMPHTRMHYPQHALISDPFVREGVVVSVPSLHKSLRAAANVFSWCLSFGGSVVDNCSWFVEGATDIPFLLSDIPTPSHFLIFMYAVLLGLVGSRPLTGS